MHALYMLSCRSVLLLCFIGFSLGGYTQEKIIQLDAEQTMLHDIFNELEQQTGYAFTYDAKLIRLQRRVSIRTAGNLGDVLDVLGKKTMLDMQISGRNILVRPVRYGKLSGKVVDEQGVPLAAVNVYVREFNQQYITDEQGGFSINYPVSRYAKLNLAFSMLGRQEQTMELSLAEQHQTVPTMAMPTLSVGLEEIAVNPATRQKRRSNSYLYIVRDVIEQSGALRLLDLLDLEPNKRSESPARQRLQQAAFRSNALSTGSQGAREPFSMNNAFGVAI